MKKQPSKLSEENDKIIGIMKNDIEYIKEDIKSINAKLDKALNTKADKKDLEKIEKNINLLENRIWYLTGGIVLSLVAAITNYIINH